MYRLIPPEVEIGRLRAEVERLRRELRTQRFLERLLDWVRWVRHGWFPILAAMLVGAFLSTMVGGLVEDHRVSVRGWSGYELRWCVVDGRSVTVRADGGHVTCDAEDASLCEPCLRALRRPVW